MTPMSRARVFFLPAAWHGSWCWSQHVIPLLSKLRYECIPIDYPRTFHPNQPATFDSYVNHIVDTIQEQHKQDTTKANVLVCHSFGGLIGTNVTEKVIQERNINIEGVIHISSMALSNGQNFVSNVLQHPSIDFSLIHSSLELLHAKQWTQIQPDRAKNIFYHDCKEKDIELALDNLAPEIQLNEQCVAQYTKDGYGKVNKLYIETTQDHFLNIEWQREIWNNLNLKREKYEVISMNTSHSPFFAQPLTLTSHLNEWMLSKAHLKLY